MSLTMIMMLTATVVSAFGHPLHLQKNTSQYNNTDSSEPLKTLENPIIRNVSAINDNETDDFPVSDLSTTRKRKTQAEGGNSQLQTRVNSADSSPFMIVLPQIEPETRNPIMRLGVGCPLPTCLTANLGSNLQTGDETAGKATSDPFGNGKK